MNKASSSGLSRQEAADRRLLAGLFRFVAGYFLEGPTEASDAVLANPQWRIDLVQSGLLSEQGTDDEIAPLKEHTHQFLRVFRVPGDAFVPPFEQAYRKGKATVDDSAVGQCATVYDEAGYELEPFKHIQADHIGHQARFLAAILDREAECLEREDRDAAATVATWRTGFLLERSAWWSSLAERAGGQEVCGQVRLVTLLAAALANTGGAA
ncbi:MAG: molecular chaperone TorD family protein [bacterium]|nr:molecular chaperone TorD family protein [bacterium]